MEYVRPGGRGRFGGGLLVSLGRAVGLFVLAAVWGGARFPRGSRSKRLLSNLVDFGKRLAPESAVPRNITIAIEPLRQQESNIINNTADELAWVECGE